MAISTSPPTLTLDLLGQPIPPPPTRAEKNTPRPRAPKPPKLTPKDRADERAGEVAQGMHTGGRTPFSEAIHPEEEWFRHHYWKGKRALVLAALDATGVGPRQRDAFINCGSECVIEWSDTEQRYRLHGSYCHSRHCEPCMKAKATLLAKNLKERLDHEPQGNYRFITLTLRHDAAESLTDQIRRLYTAWRKLRQCPIWKHGQYKAGKIADALALRKTDPQAAKEATKKALALPCQGQRGGAAIMEVKWSAAGGWHAHLHVISEGGYLHHRDLADAWQLAAPGSFKVDIRTLTQNKDVAYYLAKYVSKGTNNDVWADKEAAAEFVIATKGVRTCATYGSWRGYALMKKEKKVTDWKPVAMLRTIAARARAGSEADIALLIHLEETAQYNPGRRRTQKPPE